MDSREKQEMAYRKWVLTKCRCDCTVRRGPHQEQAVKNTLRLRSARTPARCGCSALRLRARAIARAVEVAGKRVEKTHEVRQGNGLVAAARTDVRVRVAIRPRRSLGEGVQSVDDVGQIDQRAAAASGAARTRWTGGQIVVGQIAERVGVNIVAPKRIGFRVV